MQLKSNTTTNIDIYLQGVNSYIEENNVRFQLFDIYYDESNVSSKNYKGTLNPGTYYVTLKGRTSSFINENINGQLLIYIKDIYKKQNDFDITTLLTTNNLGVYIGLNYNHLKNNYLFNYEKTLNINNDYIKDYFLIDLLQNRNNVNIYIGSVYITHPDVINVLCPLLLSKNITILNEIKNKIDINKDIEIQIATISNGFNIIVNILDLFHCEFSANVVSLSKDVINDLIETFLIKQISYKDIIKTNILSYYAGSGGKTSIEFPIYLKLSNDKLNYNCDIYPMLLNHTYDQPHNLKDQNLNSIIKCNKCFGNGEDKCEDCLKDTDYVYNGQYNIISDIIELEYYLDSYFTKYDYTLKYVDNHTHNFNYNFYDGKQHVVECECGYRYFERHATNGSSNRCLYCGGKVDKGFIIGSKYRILKNEKTNEIYLSQLLF